MTYRVRLTRNAQKDRDRVLAWYDVEASDQSERFIDEVYATARRLEDFPYSGAELRGGRGGRTCTSFSYQLWYRVHHEAQEIEILAVLHHRQDSAEFAGRLAWARQDSIGRHLFDTSGASRPVPPHAVPDGLPWHPRLRVCIGVSDPRVQDGRKIGCDVDRQGVAQSVAEFTARLSVELERTLKDLRVDYASMVPAAPTFGSRRVQDGLATVVRKRAVKPRARGARGGLRAGCG